ncbi:Pimeloyl-ACP methyl ester carboxylesterase [Chitinophaga sp. YR573]|uniref:alpha/beta fold hydrolase n=1 Tax=Chitinophaga sp. YR573 TaxID=1881040 RepID=UPI0008C6B7EA|nr:alpha/beta hydrolase [Chitinophaga sp. YR573]SEW18208.1 Pimeloyl-ACP methyl ester carboxylesterase [Chitinophaga sp. YR573]
MPVIKVNNATVHIQELNKGAKETVLLIHGMFSNLSVYYFNIAPILAQNFHVVMYDMKSHGMSAKSKDGYDLNTMTDDLLALMEALGLKSVYLAGYSYGGLVALKMAMRYPGRVKKLAVIEAPDPSDNETLGIIDIYSKEFLVDYINNFTDTTKMRMGKRQLDKNHRMYEYLFNETSIKSDMHNERAFFKDTTISNISHDTLLLYGKDSNCIDSGKKLYDTIIRSKLVFVKGDHNVPIQQPEEIANRLKDFFEGWHIKFKQINSRLWQGLRS